MISTKKLKKFIEERRRQACDLQNHKSFATQNKIACQLREENARAFNWLCDELEDMFPDLKD